MEAWSYWLTAAWLLKGRCRWVNCYTAQLTHSTGSEVCLLPSYGLAHLAVVEAVVVMSCRAALVDASRSLQSDRANGSSTSEGCLRGLAVTVRSVICSTGSMAPREGKDNLGTQLDREEGLRLSGMETRQ